MVRVVSTPRSGSFISILREAEWAHGRCKRVRKIPPLQGLDPQTGQRVESRHEELVVRGIAVRYITRYIRFLWPCIVSKV